jgi:hypothetical protein
MLACTSAGAGDVVVVGTELVVGAVEVDVETPDVVVSAETPQAVTTPRMRPAIAATFRGVCRLANEGLTDGIYSKLTPSGV